MTVNKLQERLGLSVFSMPNPDCEVTGGYAGDLLSWVMGRAQQGDAWVTIMSNQNVAAVAMMTDIACVVLSEGVQPDEGLAQRAESQGINLLGSPDSTFRLCQQMSEILNC